jgi:hypothetical protein
LRCLSRWRSGDQAVRARRRRRQPLQKRRADRKGISLSRPPAENAAGRGISVPATPCCELRPLPMLAGYLPPPWLEAFGHRSGTRFGHGFGHSLGYAETL